MKGAVEQPPATAGIQLANWYWKGVRQFVSERFGVSLCRSSCLNYLHRLGFAFKRPRKRLLKADETRREAFVAEYAALRDEAHFREDAELRGKWVLKGQPALVDSTSPQYGEKASYYSAVCLETGEVEWMELEGNSNAGTSVDFLKQLRAKHPGPLRGHLGQCPGPPWGGGAGVPQDAWAGSEAGEPPFSRGQALPGYSPDFKADEAICAWAREGPLAICAWAAGRWCRTGSANSWPGCPAGKTR